MFEFLASIIVYVADGPLVVEIIAPSCKEALVDVALALGPYVMEILSCIESVMI